MKYSYQVFLPAGMRIALKEYSPTFKIFGLDDYQDELRLELQPWATNLMCYSAVFRDFNGDGVFDAAVLGEYTESPSSNEPELNLGSGIAGKNSKKTAVLAILSQSSTTYMVTEVVRIGSGKKVSTYLGLSTPGRKSEVGSDGASAFESENYGISVTKGVGSTAYHWDNKQRRFREIVTGGM
ncbi:MAG: hypothetical protein A2049_05980 [Elusimicrobia bacterium GWA2_62_23]|nr:MAG: hypothetical protein A2049_05980 [Elusimicrobia bacterium GWA2_62_23]